MRNTRLAVTTRNARFLVRFFFIFLLIFFFLIFFLLIFSSCRKEPSIKVYFDNSEIRDYTYNFIKDTKKNLDICIYEISDKEIIDLLKKISCEGISVRIVVDDDSYISACEINYAEIVKDSDNGLMHCKYMISDRERVWFGSTNLSNTSLDNHFNDIAISSDPDIIRRFSDHFNQSFSGLFKEDRNAKTNTANVFFSPEDDPFSHIENLLLKAKKELKIGIYAFTEVRMLQILKFLSSKGVKIKVYADRSWNLSNSYSLVEEVSKFAQVRYDGRVEGLMHEKFFIVDNSFVLFGSYNFTQSAETNNDEFFVISNEKFIVDSFITRFESLWIVY